MAPIVAPRRRLAALPGASRMVAGTILLMRANQILSHCASPMRPSSLLRRRSEMLGGCIAYACVLAIQSRPVGPVGTRADSRRKGFVHRRLPLPTPGADNLSVGHTVTDWVEPSRRWPTPRTDCDVIFSANRSHRVPSVQAHHDHRQRGTL